jgi:outer membrane immunogenic protein
MRRQFALASIGAIALSGSAAAEPPIFTWTGLYIGGQVGGAWGRDPTTVFLVTPPAAAEGGGPPPPPEIAAAAVGDAPPGTVLVSTFGNRPSGVIGGIHLGYNLQIGQWVAGIEGTVDGTSISGTAVDPISGISVHTREEVQGSIRARLGFAFDRVLLYATGGAAFTGIDNTYLATTGIVTGFPGTFEKISRTRSGWTVGGGIAYAITNNWSIRAEYRFSDFGHYNDFPFAVFVPLPGILFARHELTENQVQFGISYKLDLSALAPVVARY